jgi:HPt (histidine-containing phosphotransfer) domain-containing protein
LLERCLSDTGFCRRILEKFSGRVNEQLGEIQQAVAAHNTAELKLKAHALKGAAANLSADCLWACAAELEQLAAADDWSRTLVVVGELSAEIARCRRHIPRLSAELAAR